MAEVIIADGFSCREQIAQMTDRRALHIAEVLELALRHGPGGPEGMRPESEFVREHEAALRKSKMEAAATVGGLAAGAVALASVLSKRNGHAKTRKPKGGKPATTEIAPVNEQESAGIEKSRR
jgi:hypothetical protein